MADVTRVRMVSTDRAILLNPQGNPPDRRADPFLDAQASLEITFSSQEVSASGLYAVWVWIVEADKPTDRGPRVLTADGWIANLEFTQPRGNEDEVLEHVKTGQRLWDLTNVAGMRLVRASDLSVMVTVTVRVGHPGQDDDSTPATAEFRVYAAITPLSPESVDVKVGNQVTLPIVLN